jgi:hypothetical protein
VNTGFTKIVAKQLSSPLPPLVGKGQIKGLGDGGLSVWARCYRAERRANAPPIPTLPHEGEGLTKRRLRHALVQPTLHTKS